MANALCLSPATEDSTAGSIPTLPSPTTSGGVVALKTGRQKVLDLIPSCASRLMFSVVFFRNSHK